MRSYTTHGKSRLQGFAFMCRKCLPLMLLFFLLLQLTIRSIMMCFVLVWVPSAYCIDAGFLVDHTVLHHHKHHHQHPKRRQDETYHVWKSMEHT